MSLIKSIGNKKVNLDFNKNFITIFSDKINIVIFNLLIKH